MEYQKTWKMGQFVHVYVVIALFIKEGISGSGGIDNLTKICGLCVFLDWLFMWLVFVDCKGEKNKYSTTTKETKGSPPCVSGKF